jgi:hypothetical protein
MHKGFILLLGMFLGSRVSEAAQTPKPQIVLAQVHIEPAVTMHRTVAPPLSAPSFLLYPDPGKSPAHFSLLLARAYERGLSLERLPPIEEIKTLILEQSSLPLVQLGGGRLQLDAFQSTLHSQNVLLGPLGYGPMQGFRPPRQSCPGGPCSVHLSGLSLSFHFGRDSRTGPPTQAWRRMTRFVGAVLN